MKSQINRNIKINQSNQGFTLVELVVVILILGILAATALPKFMNVNAEAHTAAVAGAGGGLGAGIALAHAQWVANGSSTTPAVVAGFGSGNVFVNASGWPENTTAAAASPITATECTNIWQGVMQNPPTLGPTNDYTVTGGTTICTYTYNGAAGKSIAYNSATGDITVTNP